MELWFGSASWIQIFDPPCLPDAISPEDILRLAISLSHAWIAFALFAAATGASGCFPAIVQRRPTDAPTLTISLWPAETPAAVSSSPVATVILPRPTARSSVTVSPSPVNMSSPAAVLIAAETDLVVPTPVAMIRPASPRVSIAAYATKISQLTGDFDNEIQRPTESMTESRYKLFATDLGVPFLHNNRIFMLFGDTHGARGGDAIAYTSNTNLEKGLRLDFVHDASGVYKPVIVPGISQGDFEVPMEGVSIAGRMYIYHTTDHTIGPQGDKMGRSVLAVSDDDGQSFTLLYDLSRQYFINVSVVQADAAAWPGLPSTQGAGLMMFGSGSYRQSNVYLAFQPEAQINTPASIRYWAGLDSSGRPIWSTNEETSKSLFNQPCVGELSASFNRFIRKWIMLYNCDMPNLRGINFRTADQPWGPWSEPQLMFRPWEDNGYCHFIHTSFSFRKCDNVQGPGLEDVWGGEYGPYQFKDLAVGDSSKTTIYFTMSTWNPYAVVLMKASLRVEPN